MPRAKKTPASENPSTDDIDFAWDEGFASKLGSSRPPPPRKPSGARPLLNGSESNSREIEITEGSGAHAVEPDLPPPREPMVTLEDEDPLRYDIAYNKQRDATRDSMPTIPDSDPLRHDIDETG